MQPATVRLPASRRVTVVLAAVLVAALAGPAFSPVAHADETDEVDTSLDTSLEGDESAPAGELTYRRALADELDVDEDELHDAARRARQRVAAYRLQQAHDAGVTDPDRRRELADEFGLTDPDLLEQSLADAEQAARSFSDRVAGEVEERATPESAEQAANWLLRTSRKLGEWVTRLTDSLS